MRKWLRMNKGFLDKHRPQGGTPSKFEERGKDLGKRVKDIESDLKIDGSIPQLNDPLNSEYGKLPPYLDKPYFPKL